ncbi:AmmeMemoRadiSam system radical SAM enzyme [Chitinispirillales bacterium ANBcel5]|uniref:AmmeMemoRadiSam system radical SAM enzyme n=1 Tax=Cellulosispirillum alkaliphilum TaxID=3039283 RepID=UPI002A53F2BB|nr:AmmeMemoRadiSam system radical SAM enzyme [Chitinispirillales bacterium ANBcel5]
MKEATLYQKLSDKRVHCFLCAHHCKIAPDGFGICSVRQNISGTLYTHSFGKAIARAIDPVEKKPLFHFLPRTDTFSVAAAGCNFKCGFCQNWQISQVDEKSLERWGIELSSLQIVENALKENCQSISFTYTEPTIFFEYALETCRIAKERGVKTIFVSNGYMTPEAINLLLPYLDAINVDLKSISNSFYKTLCKASLSPVLKSLKIISQSDVWLEITTLLVTDENDSDQQLNELSSFIANELGADIPWHISRFHPQYQITEKETTPVTRIQKAYEIAKRHQIKYVYLGNIAASNNTVCNNCGGVVVKREGYRVEYIALEDNKCNNCGKFISGVWRSK